MKNNCKEKERNEKVDCKKEKGFQLKSTQERETRLDWMNLFLPISLCSVKTRPDKQNNVSIALLEIFDEIKTF